MKITIKEKERTAVRVGQKYFYDADEITYLVIQQNEHIFGLINETNDTFEYSGSARVIIGLMHSYDFKLTEDSDMPIIGYLEDDKPMPTNKDELKTGDMFIHIGTGTVMEYLNGTFSLIGHTPSGNIVIATTQNFMETIGNYRRFHGTITIEAE